MSPEDAIVDEDRQCGKRRRVALGPRTECVLRNGHLSVGIHLIDEWRMYRIVPCHSQGGVAHGLCCGVCLVAVFDFGGNPR